MTGSGVRFIFAIHNHQPVGNFNGVFDLAFREGYQPFLQVMEDYPDIPFVLHTSGPLVEWLAEHQPEYVERLRVLVGQRRLEILGGGFFEPILTMLPHRDRVGQIRRYSEYLHELLGAEIRGMWVPERVWEQSLVASLVEAGIEYTVLDDFHFQRAGLTPDQLDGYYLTEHDGQLLKVFPGSERLRYMIPFHEPHSSYEFLQRLADERPGATLVHADDGEKFGSWPETHDHCFTRGWVRRFCDMLRGNRSWLHPTTFSEAVDNTLPLGKIYLPDGSYREMTEWALPPGRLVELKQAMTQAENVPAAQRLRRFAMLGGYWRNFKVKYAESDEMYSRMLGLSNRLAADEALPSADPDYLEIARDELYRGQCNCPYWHGSFGGLYLPHLRNAIYRHLIAAHNALDDAEGKTGPRVLIEAGDFNLDARQEVRLENDHLVAFVRPACGGHVYELDVRESLTNVLNTLDRRPEPYHAAVAAKATGQSGEAAAFVPDRVILKQEGLDRLIAYDRHPRKALVDHVYPMDVTLDDLTACRDIEQGDLVQGAYLARISRQDDRVSLMLERSGLASGHAIKVRKTLTLRAGSPALQVDYSLDELPEGVPIHFAIELNLAGMAGHADDRYYSDVAGQRLGMLDSTLDLADRRGVTLTDEWLNLVVGLEWTQPGGLWAFPIETVSQSEGGFEKVYQSSAVVPHWIIQADSSRHWDLSLTWTLRPLRSDEASSADRGSLLTTGVID
ncbi:MAG: alpha-amylase/4-alpha-glucanotransferase domain-containing protein [Isosphaeraceae bacterium]